MDMFYRPRRLRQNKLIRELLAETTINSNRLIQPYFVCEGENIKEEINGLPGIYRESVDSLVKSIAEDKQMGINNVMLFGVTDRKDQMATSSCDDKNPVLLATKNLKDKL